jgi:hypothetical protein
VIARADGRLDGRGCGSVNGADRLAFGCRGNAGSTGRGLCRMWLTRGRRERCGEPGPAPDGRVWASGRFRHPRCAIREGERSASAMGLAQLWEEDWRAGCGPWAGRKGASPRPTCPCLPGRGLPTVCQRNCASLRLTGNMGIDGTWFIGAGRSLHRWQSGTGCGVRDATHRTAVMACASTQPMGCRAGQGRGSSHQPPGGAG